MFFIIFIIIPLIEVILFITVGKYIGLWNTISIIIITGIIGAILVKNQGISVLKKGLKELQSNKLPLKPMLEAVAIVVAGAFLLTPGFLTDTLGAILLIPILRGKILEIAIKFLKKKIKYKTNFYDQNTNNNIDNNVYEGKYEEIKEDDEKKE
tara:strand:- start:143 stop:601 length:459 start_codon:yes stop_codon:yes gene_type:complete